MAVCLFINPFRLARLPALQQATATQFDQEGVRLRKSRILPSWTARRRMSRLVVLTMTGTVEAYRAALVGPIAFTQLFNTAGNPAMSVPLRWSPEGLPVGVQGGAPVGDEATLFRLAAQLEAAQPWATRRPPRAI
jgi:hypothetical protein